MTSDLAGVYLRPGGLLGGTGARQAVEQGKAGLIAGGWAAFSLVEVIERGKRCWHNYSDFAGSNDQSIAGLLEVIKAPRSAIAGLSMTEIQIMGIVNVTPDSFSDGGAFLQSDKAIAHGRQLHVGGASLLDIGGESTRPGADVVSLEDEVRRVVPVFEGLKGLGAPLSVDTRKPYVMKAAGAAGAEFVNDVTALSFDNESLKVVSELDLPVCLMHSQGTPDVMQDNPQYDNVVLDVYDYLAGRIQACIAAGIAADKIVIDPGIGFGKTVRHNLALIDEIAMFHGLGVPVLLGASRKSFMGAIMADKDAGHRLPGSLAVALAGVRSGVQILRVHDVAETVQAVRIEKACAFSSQF